VGRGKMRKPRLAAQAGRGAGEDDGAAPERSELPGGLAADEEAAEAADAPEILELLSGQLAEIDALVVASVEDHEVGRLAAVARRNGPVEETSDVVLVRRIDGYGFGAPARSANCPDNLLDLLGCPSRDEHVIATGCKSPT